MNYKNKLDKDYLDLVNHVLKNGVKSGDRTGTGTIKTFVNVLRHDMRTGFPLLTTKSVFFKGVVHELLWFLSGSSNIKYMLENNVFIWVGDTYKKYKNTVQNPLTEADFIQEIINNDDFAKKWGELGPVYGSQWRNWNGDDIDQIKGVIHDLKTNPDSRRHIVTAWNPSKLKDMTLPPCHNMFQFFTEEIPMADRLVKLIIKIGDISVYLNEDGKFDETTLNYLFNQNNIPQYYLSVNFNMRSVDVGLGLPFDIASYGILLLMIAKETQMEAKELICTLNDTHIYLDQVEKIKEQFERDSYDLPTLELNPLKTIDEYTIDDLKLINYKNAGKLNLPLSN